MLLDSELKRINHIYKELLGYCPKTIKLEYTKSVPIGTFSIRNRKASINPNFPFSKLTLLHEFFGHGLFFEYSDIGKKLTNLEEALLKEEQRYFKEGFTLEDLRRFRYNHPIYHQIKHYEQEILEISEAFAIWTEYMWSPKEIFELVHKNISPLAEKLIEFSKRDGKLAGFYSAGLPRIPTKKRVIELLNGIFPDQTIRLAVLFGSRKKYSDVDIMVVSDNIKSMHNRWIDIRAYTEKEFFKKLELFDLRVIDPLISGEIIIQDRDYSQIIKKIQNQEIRCEAIQYNLHLAQKFKEMGREDYFHSYSLNAYALTNGKKCLSYSQLMKL